MRGYAAIALVQPKSGDNVGGVLRAAGVFGASLVVLGGKRAGTLIRHRTNTIRAERRTPTIVVESVLDAIPFDCVPVCIEFVAGARDLPSYAHPERAFYIFGPEDGSVPKAIEQRCRDVVMIPSIYCLNLAAAVNVVLYDRMVKGVRK